ncbi:MAG TPA: polysaccharide biosynthesis/export family protein [Puia sp.]
MIRTSRLNGVIILVLSSFFLANLLCSCGNTRHLTYLQGQFDTTRLSQIQQSEAIIQKGDLLSIIVYSDNPGATSIYNQSVSMGASSIAASTSTEGGTGSKAGAQSTAGSPISPGYLVDEEGNIQFQGLGRLHVEGLSKTGLKSLLDSKLKDTLLTNPYYTIRFLNYKFTMLGEVTRPGIFSLPGERISLLEALGLAGDMTFYGRRDNILVIREVNGKREFGRMDITKPDVMASPYYYLQPNDVVIVEANKKKIAANDQVTFRNVSIGVSILSTFAILFSLFRK